MGVFVENGKNGKVTTMSLPSGDVTVKGTGDSYFVSVALRLAKAHGGYWNEGYGNWIVPARSANSVHFALGQALRRID